VQPVAWRKTSTGGLSAENEFKIPPAAKLGEYQVELRGGAEGRPRNAVSGSFRVEEFRCPCWKAASARADKKPLVDAQSLPVEVQVQYVAGGAAANLPVRVSALVRAKALEFADYSEFSFQAPRGKQAPAAARARRRRRRRRTRR
jgi:uncharacterized protein YfaS (alpha-2-macroglobulin family)